MTFVIRSKFYIFKCDMKFTLLSLKKSQLKIMQKICKEYK
nr:MAG TPA: hypothetical protein [Caudoviricetes sp.]